MTENEKKFISRVNLKYGDDKYKFDKLNYVNSHTKVELYCVAGGHYFVIAPMHMVSEKSKGCNVCQKNTAYTSAEFILKCQEKHGSTYSYENTVYVNQKVKVKVFCNGHNGEIEISPATLLNKNCKCGICHGKYGITTDIFVQKAKTVHNNQYAYDKVDYINSDTKVLITCNEHGDFSQEPKSHLRGRGCPKCGKYGYQPNNPGYFYVQKLESPSGAIYKYGITGDMERRLHEQSRDSVYTHTVLVERYFEDGNQPLVLERFMKTFIDSGVATVDELPSGFTETFDEKYLETVLAAVNSFNSKEED